MQIDAKPSGGCEGVHFRHGSVKVKLDIKIGPMVIQSVLKRVDGRSSYYRSWELIPHVRYSSAEGVLAYVYSEFSVLKFQRVASCSVGISCVTVEWEEIGYGWVVFTG